MIWVVRDGMEGWNGMAMDLKVLVLDDTHREGAGRIKVRKKVL